MDKAIFFDDWLASILGKDTYRLIPSQAWLQKIRDTSSEEYHMIRDLQSSPVFIYAKAPVEATPTCTVLESFGFHLIDTNMVFDKPTAAIQSSSGNHLIRLALSKDRERVMVLAGSNFQYSRFHLDPFIPHEVANQIKAEWAGNYFTGKRGDEMVVAYKSDNIVGFLQLLYGSNKNDLIIDLIAVDRNERGKGVASDMIQYAENRFMTCSQIIVGTQVANIPSIRLYEKIGFRLRTAQYVFHYHHK